MTSAAGLLLFCYLALYFFPLTGGAKEWNCSSNGNKSCDMFMICAFWNNSEESCSATDNVNDGKCGWHSRIKDDGGESGDDDTGYDKAQNKYVLDNFRSDFDCARRKANEAQQANRSIVFEATRVPVTRSVKSCLASNSCFVCPNITATLRQRSNYFMCNCKRFCHEKLNKSDFSLRDAFPDGNAVIGSLVLVAYVWIVGLLASAGNVVVIASSLKSLLQKYRTLSNAQRVHSISVLNLAVADLLMGVYLISLGIVSSIHSKSYDRESRYRWLLNPACEALGVINFLSGQVSVALLVVMSCFRLYSFITPFGSVRVRAAVTWTALCWMIWISFAIVPLVENDRIRMIFDRSIVMNLTNIRNGSKIKQIPYTKMYYHVEDVLGNLNKKCKSHNISLSKRASWKELRSISEQIFTCDELLGYIGFYNGNEMCTMKYFVNPYVDDVSAYFTLSIIIHNASAFLFIFFAYCYVYSKTTGTGCRPAQCCFPKCLQHKENRHSANRRAKEDERLHRLITVILATDFFCWIPMCCTVVWYFARTSGIGTNSKEYVDFFKNYRHSLAVFALIVIPINSSINPFIHSTRLRTLCWLALNSLRSKFAQRRNKEPVGAVCNTELRCFTETAAHLADSETPRFDEHETNT